MSLAVTAPVLLGLSLQLVACGSAERAARPASDVGGLIMRAAEETQNAGTAGITVTFEHTRSDATWGIEAGERGQTLEGVVDFGEYLVALEDEHRQYIVDGSAMYFKDEYERDTRWRKYDLDRRPIQGLASLLFRRLDPVRLLTFISSSEDAAAPFEVVGEEEVRGVATTHYRGYAENEALARAFVPGVSYEELVQPEREPLSKYSLLEAWVGDDGRLHKVVYDFDGFGVLFGERTIVELYDFGAGVAVEVPSPDETVDAGRGASG